MSETLLEPAAAALPYLAEFEDTQRPATAGEPRWLSNLRERAIERFATRGFPSTREEEWRFTNLAPLTKQTFTLAQRGANIAPAALESHVFDLGSRLVFVDGRFAPELSHLAALPPGVVVESLAAVLVREPARLEGALGAHATALDHPFVALNTAFFRDGAYVELPKGAVLEAPLQVLHIASGRPVASYPRNLVVAREGSQAIVVETFVGFGDDPYLTAAVMEMVLEPGAVIDHSKLQKESPAAFHLATSQFHLARASSLYSHSISTGGALVRNDVNAVLGGEGADCTLNGLYVLRGRQFLDNHMRVDHNEPHTTSYELFKGILDEKSRAVFNGRIFVAKGAQKTDAKQSSRNLLLSKEALVNANPQLEIFADDVKCTHGSTVGQLDEEAIFYLRSRGIGEEAAKSLLTYAFASDIVERIKVPAVRHELTEFLFDRLPKGEVVRQAV